MGNYRNLTIDGDRISGEQRIGTEWVWFVADFSLLHIRTASERDEVAFMAIWSAQDGIPGRSIYDYDWSAIRDSSDKAIATMQAIAEDYLPAATFRAELEAARAI